MKLGFIGAGNMARAIINGLIAEQKISGEDVYIHSVHKSSYESYAKEKGLNPCERDCFFGSQTNNFQRRFGRSQH